MVSSNFNVFLAFFNCFFCTLRKFLRNSKNNLNNVPTKYQIDSIVYRKHAIFKNTQCYNVIIFITIRSNILISNKKCQIIFMIEINNK